MKKIIILCAVALFASAAVFTAVKVTRSSGDLYVIENAEALAEAESDAVRFPCAPTPYNYCEFDVILRNGATGTCRIQEMYRTDCSPVRR